MSEVWKYNIDLADIQENKVTVLMPAGATVLSTQAQFDHLTIWALVNPYVERVPRRFNIVGTGMFTSTNGRFLGTVQLLHGAFVVHVWDEGEA